MDTAIEELGQVALALRYEREEEEQRLAEAMRSMTLKERAREGFTRHPLSVSKLAFGWGGAPELTLERQAGAYPPDDFAPGSPVFLKRDRDDEAPFKGVVSKINQQVVSVSLLADQFPDDARSGRYTLDLRFDDKTFFEMEKALNFLINVEEGRAKQLRDVILGFKASSGYRPDAGNEPIDAHLNPSQQEAVRAILSTEDIALVHGPPGTGKTTTLVEAIRLVSRKNEKTLVCAPTNAAADLLTLKLAAAGVDVVRIGHASRLVDAALPHAFDQRLSAMPEMKLVADLRRRAQEAFQDADRYRRNFGPEERRARSAAKHEGRDLNREARETERFAETKLLESVQAVVCTLVGATDKRLAHLKFDLAVIDEAGQALEPAAWIPVLKAERVVLAGDPFQLPPTVKSAKAAKSGLSVTLLEKAIERTGKAILLNEQYRMNKRIMGFSNAWFYGGQLQAHTSVTSHQLAADEPVLEFIDTAGCGFDESHPAEGSKHSLVNPDEANLLVKHLNALLERCGGEIKSVGVISPYRAQVEWLEPLLGQDQRITVQTVDGFQGRESDVIYISLTRSNDRSEIGFLSDYRRMNVAMTRARRKLVIVGDSATLGADAFYSAFIAYCEGEEAYRSAWELM